MGTGGRPGSPEAETQGRRFRDRRDAGRVLGRLLEHYRSRWEKGDVPETYPHAV